MRTDLTVLGAYGARDVAVLAPPGTRLRDVDAALRRIGGLSSADRWHWRGRCLSLDAQLGKDVSTAAVLTGDADVRSEGLLNLIVCGGPDAGASIELSRGAVVIGRAASCDLVLTDPAVSRQHATLHVDGRAVRVEDLGSANGTYVDGSPIDRQVELTSDVIVRIGDTLLRIADSATDLSTAEAPTTIVWPAAPSTSSRPRVSWAAVLVPLLAAGAFAIMLRNAQLLMFMLLSPLSMFATLSGERVSARRTRRTACRSYTRSVAEAHSAVQCGLRAERLRRHAELPDPYAFALWLSRPPALATRGSDVRLGLGTAPARLTVTRNGAATSAALLDLVPIAVELTRATLRITGPRQAACELAYWVVLQLAARHPGPLEVSLVVEPEWRADWEWARWLPGIYGPPRIAARPSDPAASRLAVFDRGASGSGGCEIEVRLGALDSSDVITVAQHDAGTVEVRSPDGSVQHALADRVNVARAEELARQVSVARCGGATEVGLPATCRLLDLLGVGCAAADGVRKRWAGRGPGTPTVIGRGDTGPVLLDLARDGPHALIAGTTGSGKSELLQAWVISLAATYPPDEVSFVLVDYKGGAAFGPSAALPHVCALVTDLDADTTGRMLISLDAELTRRERLFAQARVADVDMYRTSEPVAPLARLIIVIDEFAALMTEQREFLSGLISVAQRGRSLGVHLVLATQRPGGVVSPEIRANTSLRIALRMTDPAESRDVVGVASAAELSSAAPGRAVVATAGTTAVVQLAAVSSAYDLDDPPVVVPLGPWRTLACGDAQQQPRRTDLDVLVDAIVAAAHEEGRSAALCPWLDPLPMLLPASQLPEGDDPLRIPVGLADHPREQRRETLLLDLARGESIGIAGSARTGRTTVLTSLVLAACRRLAPDDCAVYLVDGGSGALHAVEALPHVATVTTCRDPEHVARLAHGLSNDVARRRDYLYSLGYGSAHEALRQGTHVPTALVAIDGWENCVHALDALDGGQTSACLLALISTGPTVGVSVVVTGHRELLAPRLSGSFSTRYALRFTDRSDYALLGLAPATAPACCPPGRGVRGGDSAVVQFAHEGSAPSLDAARSVALRIAGSAGVRKGSKLPPVIVRALPRQVRLADLVAPAGRLVLGVGGDAAEPVALDLAGPPIRMLITGPPGSGRTTLLHLLLHQAPDEQRVAVAAAPGSPLADIARACGTRLLAPSDKEGCSIGDATLLLVDDAEAFAGTPAESVLLEWIAAQGPRTATFATTSNAEVAVAHRGTVAELRRSRQGVVLCPRQSDGEPFGIRLPPRHGEPIPGRGVLIGGRRSSVPVPIQVAMACDVTPCAGIGGPSAGRTSP